MIILRPDHYSESTGTMMAAKSYLKNFWWIGVLMDPGTLCFSGAELCNEPNAPYVIVLGIAQDGGVPQAGCQKNCCRERWSNAAMRQHVTCLAMVDPATNEHWLIEATPDFKSQLRTLAEMAPKSMLSGIFLTHGHIGHYTGLMHLGREVIGSREIPVYVMPRMQNFLKENGPWDQLVRLKNIVLRPMQNDSTITLNRQIRVTPFLVPHRDEYTETAGFRLGGPRKSVLFIPDIDKWEKWERRLEAMLASADVAYVDGTFYAEGEIPGRNMSEIPHPFITETVQRLAALPLVEKNKVRFIHLNHTNPALQRNSAAAKAIEKAGFKLAQEGERFEL
jgi:pyrroloquinoline quinone biosynthesis protein B